MLDGKTTDQLEKGLRSAWIIWAFMTGFLFLYLIGAEWVVSRLPPSNLDRQTGRMITYCLAGVGALTFFASFAVKKLFMGKRRLVVAAPSSTHLNPAVTQYQVGLSLSFALCESVGIYGLVLFFLNRNFTLMVVFLLAALAGMMALRPKKEELVQLAENFTNQK